MVAQCPMQIEWRHAHSLKSLRNLSKSGSNLGYEMSRLWRNQEKVLAKLSGRIDIANLITTGVRIQNCVQVSDYCGHLQARFTQPFIQMLTGARRAAQGSRAITCVDAPKFRWLLWLDIFMSSRNENRRKHDSSNSAIVVRNEELSLPESGPSVAAKRLYDRFAMSKMSLRQVGRKCLLANVARPRNRCCDGSEADHAQTIKLDQSMAVRHY